MTSIQEQLIAEEQRVLDDLDAKREEGHPMSLDDPRALALLKKGWEVAGAWAGAYLDNHPNPSTSQLKQMFEGFAPERDVVKSPYGDFPEYHGYNFAGSAIRIAPAVYVVSAVFWMDNETGTFMIVGRNRGGRFQTLWNVKDLAEKHYAQGDEIGRWWHLVRRAYYNGPLNVKKVIALYPAANGHPRFLVDAYQSAEGGTALAQLSIWEWDDREAKPLLVKPYQYEVDFGDSVRFDGKTVRISTKEDMDTLFTGGMCPDPQGIWTIRVTPTGLQDLGHKFLDPQYHWADQLLFKVEKGADTSNLADPKVVAAVKAMITKDKDPSEKEFFWGMVDRLGVLSQGPRGEFELTTDGYQIRFSYVRRNGGAFFTDISIQPFF